MRHDKEHVALQEHSVGDEYPWTIQRIGDQYCQPLHCLTSEKGPEFYLQVDRTKTGQPSAYRLCELWIAKRKAVEPPIVLNEYTFLIPVEQGKTGETHNPAHWRWLEHKLVGLFEGFTKGCCADGSWIGAQGDTVQDRSRVYKVALEPSKFVHLANLLDECKSHFDQECIYLAKTSDCVRLV